MANRQFVNWRDPANQQLIAIATRSTISQYVADRTGSLDKIKRNRGFAELVGEIGKWMGFGRSRVWFDFDTATVEFEFGELGATSPADMAVDRATDMAHLLWVERFMLQVAGLQRREFDHS